MPSLVKEITQGDTKTREQGGAESGGAGSAARVFRVVLNSPGEQFNEQEACGVTVGSAHPTEPGFSCISFTRSYEGESRMVVNVTFNYQFLRQQENNDQPPDSRPANWSISSAIYEKPCYFWRQRKQIQEALVEWWPDAPASNPLGDMYDGVTEMAAMVTISISQWVLNDPTVHAMFVGTINQEEITLGSLVMKPHTVMLRGIQATPTVEEYQGGTYRGWIAAYEFAYRENITKINRGTRDDFDEQEVEVALGWDIAVPMSGFNCRAFNPKAPRPDQDVYGQPLLHVSGKIDTGDIRLPETVNPGDKVRAMVRVFSYEDGGASQLPSAQPIPLNRDGTPRLIENIDSLTGRRPLVHGYQVHYAINFTDRLKLRLSN